jgi:hypothetical protein
MNERAMTDELNSLAANAATDLDVTDELLAAQPMVARDALAPLLQLADRMKAALSPVEPRQEFVAQLRAKLVRQSRRTHALAVLKREDDKRRLLWIAAGAGGIVYFAGMAVVSLRLSLAVLSLVAGLLGWKLARPAAVPKQGVTR